MRFSENWLGEFVHIDADRVALRQRLTMAGLEVENIEVLGDGLAGVVVAEILACEPHANADKLRVCTVAAGAGEPLQIVCGAPNARPGLKAPLATIGAKLPNGIEIKKTTLRGVESNGMLCSARELGIDADASGLLELPPDAPVGKALAEYLGFPDASIELKLTPNRPDCLSLRGLACDVAALFDTSLHEPKYAPVTAQITTQREVRLEAGADCPRYLGRVIEGINAAARSPLWLTERLRRSGMRPISAVVDITNYVMLELGQPLHAFDHNVLEGGLSIRRAYAGEMLKLLDGNETKLDPEFLLIADAKKPLALAGITGGYDSRITESTKNIFLESAHFAPSAIMGRARKLGLHTDAAHRFERGVDPELPRLALERATALLIEIVGGKPGPVTETILPDHMPKRAPVLLRRVRLARVLGIAVPDAEIERILQALGMRLEAEVAGWRVTPPSRRFDIEIEEDLLEEIVRVYGYDRVPIRPPSGELKLNLPAEAQVPAARIRAQLAARGYREAVCYSFVPSELLQRWSLDDGAITLANPLSTDLAVMRTSLLPGLVEALKYNLNRQQERVRLFEIGRVFAQGTGSPVETPRIAAVVCGNAHPENWASDKRPVDFFDLKADVETLLGLRAQQSGVTWHTLEWPYLHPVHSAQVCLDQNRIGIIGSLHPRLLKTLGLDQEIYVFELDMASSSMGHIPQAAALSRFPSVRRDIAMILPNSIAYNQVDACVRAAIGALLIEVIVFDQYAGVNLGSDVKSLAMGLILQDSSRTLTVGDVDRCVAAAVSALERECQAKLRG